MTLLTPRKRKEREEVGARQALLDAKIKPDEHVHIHAQ
jgi:hypothetical protein